VKFAICNETYQNWSFEDQVRDAAEKGYAGMELAPFTLASSAYDVSPERRRELRRVAKDHGIELTGLHWLLLGPPGLCLTSPDPGARRKTVDYLRELCRLCSDLGGTCLVFGSPKQRNLQEGVTYDQAWAWAREGFQQAAETAAERGVFLLMEALPKPECNFIQTVPEALRMVEDVGHPHFQMMVDVKSMAAEGRPLDEIILSVGDRLKHVHANDANRRGPGFGSTDFRPVFSALKRLGYQGYVSVEVFDYTPDPQTIARESLKYLRAILAQVEGRL
jgi:sugar phosphate isomerase/epimerase